MDMKKFFLIPFLFLVLIFSAYSEKIDASNNAVWHNAMGLEYMRQANYPAAIAEYKTAIALKPATSASAAFHNNLGLAYLKINRPHWATVCFENAIQLNPNSFYFYQNLVDSYEKSGDLSHQYSYFKQKSSANHKNSYNWLMLGLLQEKRREYKEAINSFNNYTLLEPEIVVSQAVKAKIAELKKRI